MYKDQKHSHYDNIILDYKFKRNEFFFIIDFYVLSKSASTLNNCRTGKQI